MPVLVQQHCLEELALPGGNDDRRRVPVVAGRRVSAAAESLDLRLGNDDDPDVADLVPVRGGAQDARVPLGVCGGRAHVEGDRPALVVVRRDDRRVRVGSACESKGCDERNEEATPGHERIEPRPR